MKKTKWSRYLWQLFALVIEVTVALMVLTVGSSTFERVAIGILVAIYAQMRLIAFGLDAGFAEAERGSQARMILLARTLRTNNEIFDDELASAVEIYKPKAQKEWIPIVGVMVIFLVAAYRLVTAVL